ncbi:IPT/TIG domain-containing protein [Fulvivirga ulvae]|uniref:FISUMP domain-containing protein n=1 Tax=Fulvivirga ulvae TaxID=2904245 RepID=UPI001F2BF749|nr:FISUMP domain-containing protein [Fulvivirga ulvae]UII29644.1 IPT/TIG domain-containing protein [Fulvivirga ulvae]
MKNTLTESVKNSLLALILFMALSIISSCGGDDDGDTAPQQPSITGIEPAKGEVDDVVTITGSNFSTTASNNTVSFNGVESTVTSATATEIKTTVPAAATTGKITVTVEGMNPATSTSDFVVYNCYELTLTLKSGGYSIEAEASGGTTPYEYALDNGSYQSESSIDADATDHTVKVRDANGCEASASIAADALKTYTDKRDGQIYSVVKIGDQVWLGENFNLNTNTADSTSSWCPEDIAANCDTYGRLYTWYAASEMAPEGWRLPSQADWETLIAAVGGAATGGKAIQEGDFAALRSGDRDKSNTFSGLGTYGYYWASTVDSNNENLRVYYLIDADDPIDNSSISAAYGFSIRLIKE